MIFPLAMAAVSALLAATPPYGLVTVAFVVMTGFWLAMAAAESKS